MAQKLFNNSVRLHSGGYHQSTGLHYNKQTSLLGVYYERRVFKRFSLSAGYSFWRRLDKYTKAARLEYTGPDDFNTSVGSIEERRGYKMIDISAFHNFNLYRQKHLLKAGAGVSCFWGQNRCVERYYWIEEHGWITDNYFDNAVYCGIVPQVTYDYNFLRNRLNVGFDIRARFYKGVPKTQYDAGIHVGLNF